MEDYVGKQLGYYRLTEHIGRGGYADVFLGEHIHLKNRKVAIKVLKGALTEEDIEKFREEAQRIHDLQHPHIIRMIDFGVTPLNGRNIPFLVMDYAPHGSLSKHYPLGSTLPLATIISYVKPIAEALQYAHSRGVIHRDIKPANFLMGEDDQILLGDFGIAIASHATYSMPAQDVIGSPAHMAPEQFDGKPRLASDQYALGVVVYEWLCGEPLFGGPSWGDFAYQHKFVAPTPLRQLGVVVPSSIDQVILKALDKDYKKRFAGVQEFVDTLEQAYHTYEEEMATWLNGPEYTVDMLRSEDVQFALIQRSIADPEWWENNGQVRIDTLRLKGEKEADTAVATVLLALARKAKSKAVTAVSQENGAVFESMLSLMIFCATPASRYPAVWTSLLKELTDGKALAFVARREAVYAQLLRLWSTLSPTMDGVPVDPWLPQSWSEFGTFFSLRLPDEWNYRALLPLLDMPIPSEALQYMKPSDIDFIESFFRYLLAPQKHSTAVRWFTRLVESGYTKNMQNVMELVLASPHLTLKERIDVLETSGKQLLSHFPHSSILLDHVRKYLQAFNVSELEKPSSAKAFLQSLSDLSQQLPSDVQQAIKCWYEISDFIDQPTFERATLESLAVAVSSLPLEIHSALIKLLATTFISCLEDEFDLINVVYALSPVLKTETLKVLSSMADVVGQVDKQQHSDIRLIPYIRFILEIEKVYAFLPTDQEQFVQIFLDTLFQKTNNDAFKKLHKLITAQNWPQKVFTKWNTYALKRIPKPDLQSSTSSVLSSQERSLPLGQLFRSCVQVVMERPTLSQTIVILISTLFYCLLIAFLDQSIFKFFFELPQIGYNFGSYIYQGWIIIGLFEIVPLFFGALLGPWAGCLVGGGGFAIGAFISLHFGYSGLAVYTYSDRYLMEGGYLFLSVYYAVIGFTAGLAFSRTRGRYETLYNIAVAEVFGFMGAALAFLFASVSLDARFHAPFELELIPFLATFPSLVLFPLLLVLWEKLKIAYSSLKGQW